MADTNATDACSAYGEGWCCTSTGTTLTVHSYDVTIFSVLLSTVIIAMLAFLVYKIAQHYHFLHNPPPSSKSEKHSLETTPITTPKDLDSYDKSKYLAFAEHIIPPASPISINADQYTTEADFTADEAQTELDTLSADYIMELPDRHNSSSLINVYRQYEKHLGVASKFLEKQEKEKPQLSMRGFHFIYLLLLAVWLLVECVILLATSSNSTTARIFDAILYISHGFIDNLIIVNAFFPGDSKKYILISIGIVLSFVVVASFTSIFYSFGICHQCSFFYPAPEAFFTYLIFLIFYSSCLIIYYAKRTTPRPSIIPWVWYLLWIYLLAVFGSGIVYFGASDFGFCIMNFVMLLYAALMVPMLHHTLKADSDYLSSEDTIYSGDVTQLVARVYDNLKRHAVCWIPYEELVLKDRLGLGAAGEVYKGSFLETPVAIKRLFDNQSQALEDFFKEVTLMSKLSHPNILLFIGVCVRDNGDRFIITEMMDRGSVFDLIHPNLSFSAIRDPDADSKLTARRIHKILLQCAQGMSYLHSFRPPIVHRDLKSHNLLVDHNWNVKVGDFGLSRPQSAELMTAAGTPQWTAPEVIRHDHYTTKADVYSFGIIIFELLSGKIPFIELAPLTAAHRVAYEGLRPEFPDYCDSKYSALAKECWKENPDDRPNFNILVDILQKMLPPNCPKHSTSNEPNL